MVIGVFRFLRNDEFVFQRVREINATMAATRNNLETWIGAAPGKAATLLLRLP